MVAREKSKLSRMSEPTSSQAADKATSRNMKWTDAHDDVLLRIMLEMRKEGKCIPGGFTSEGWGFITKEMQTKYGPKFSKDKLKNRFKSLKKWYSSMKSMLNLNGFEWDKERKKVIAEDRVWDDYIAAHPGHNIYRSRRMPDYLIMCKIFGDSIVNGREEMATNDVPRSPPSIHNDALDDNGMNVDDDATPHNEEVGDEHISAVRGVVQPLEDPPVKQEGAKARGCDGDSCRAHGRCDRSNFKEYSFNGSPPEEGVGSITAN